MRLHYHSNKIMQLFEDYGWSNDLIGTSIQDISIDCLSIYDRTCLRSYEIETNRAVLLFLIYHSASY